MSRTTVTPGGMQALFLALSLIVDLGSNVVYVSPQWPNIHNAIHLIGGEPRAFPLSFDTDWRLDLDALFAACDARTRAIFLSTPSNPTGWTASADEMQALLEFSAAPESGSFPTRSTDGSISRARSRPRSCRSPMTTIASCRSIPSPRAGR